MAFTFAYSLGEDNDIPVWDMPLDTVTNYQNSTGTNGVTKGDLIFIDATSGLIKRAKQATGGATVHGVLEGTEFTGLANGTKYAATNSSYTSEQFSGKYPNGVAKIRRGAMNVYRVPVKTGQTASAANIGKKYGISADAAGDQTIDLTVTGADGTIEVVDYSVDGKIVFVRIPLV